MEILLGCLLGVPFYHLPCATAVTLWSSLLFLRYGALPTPRRLGGVLLAYMLTGAWWPVLRGAGALVRGVVDEGI